MLEILKKGLSSRFASVAFFSVAILAKIQLLRLYLQSGSDELTQALMAKNYLEGHGLTVNLSSVSDLSKIAYTSFTGWPPGYSVLLMPFFTIFSNHLVLSSFCIDVITAIIFFIYLRKTLLVIGFPVWLTNLFILFQGFFLPTYIVESTPTDFLGAALLLASVYYCIKITSLPRYSSAATAALALFSFCSVMLKYQNMAISLLLPCLLIYAGIVQKKKYWFKPGLISLAVLLLTCGGLFLYQQLFKGSSFYIQPAESGFFPKNLLHTYPFAAGSLVNLEFYTMQLSLLFNTSYTTASQMIKNVSSVLAILFFILYAGYLLRNRLRITNTLSSFMIFGGLAATATVLLLVLLSLTRSSYIGPPMFNWTFVSTGRYYSFVFLFIQVALWWWLFLTPFQKKPVKQVLAVLLAGIVAVEIMHGIYFGLKKSSDTIKPITRRIVDDERYDVVTSVIHEQTSRGRKVVIGNFRNLSWSLAGWYNCATLSSPDELNKEQPKSSAPAVLLLMLDKDEIFLMEHYLKQPGVQLYKEMKESNFYIQYIEPATTNNR